MSQVKVYFVYLFLDGNQRVVGFVRVKLSDAHHLYIKQFQKVFAGNFADEIFLERLQSLVYVCNNLILRCTVFETFVFVNAVFDKYFFERSEEQLFLQFGFLNLKFGLQQVHGMLTTDSQHFTHAQKAWLVVVNHTTVGRNAQLAIGKSIQGINRFVGR